MFYKVEIVKKVDQNLKILAQILKEHNINYWVCHGTLLGIIRDKKLINWDHDIDIAVLENKNLRRIFPTIMKKKGFKEVKKTFLKEDGMLKFVKKGGREVDINFYKIDKFKKNVYVKWYIPKNSFMKILDVLSFSKKYRGKYHKFINLLSFSEKIFQIIKKFLVIRDLFYKNAGYSHHKKYASNIKKYKFNGIDINIPNNSIGYLKDLYGNNWRIPRKNYNWVKNSPSTIILKANEN